MNRSGIILIILGCVFLASNFDLLRWSWLAQWWPLILIAVGVYSILDPTERRAKREREERERQTSDPKP